MNIKAVVAETLRLARPYMVVESAPDGRLLNPRRYWTRWGAQRVATRYEEDHAEVNRVIGYRHYRATVRHRVTDSPLSDPWRGARYHKPLWERES